MRNPLLAGMDDRQETAVKSKEHLENLLESTRDIGRLQREMALSQAEMRHARTMIKQIEGEKTLILSQTLSWPGIFVFMAVAAWVASLFGEASHRKWSLLRST